ncbi:tubulin polyglutamylase ttll6 isoform X4 [Dunckerocampus dactyliophorus]|uniref:tubulin polyglutamylase ttll6 isoform X4 n=1 Tax=Dunckerocampus dactyliophorus TaxID=161453 RepID=UPI0024054DDA|nr:tubulin polyglutamylase ttll6 isoform X4 [Dunckerocampus dactyliophorus]
MALPEMPEGTRGGNRREDREPDDTLTQTPASIRKKRRRLKRRLCINLSNCKYESVRRAARRYGLREAMEGSDWTLMWSDCSVSLERVKAMKQYQKINHFPGMIEICRKDTLARNLNRMLKLFPKDYNIFPRTWCLPADYSDFLAFARLKKHVAFICKPDAGSQGRGIFITRSSRDIQPGERMICQLYISKPLVIDGYKFDLRIYVLVTSCDPLRIFLFEEGLARFCTTKYTEPAHGNVDKVCMHLTNYSINKHSDNFVHDHDMGSKRKLSALIKQLEAACGDTDKLWSDVEDVIIKTLISVQPVLRHNYHTCFPSYAVGSACFEILGFDILLDQRLRPWVLEVNHSPSFTTDSALDREVKDALLYDTLLLINLGACNRSRITKEESRRAKERLQENRPRVARSEELRQCQAASAQRMASHERKHLGGFRRIFPREGGEKYDKFFNQSNSLVQPTEASRARQECARQQLQELREKQRDVPGVRRGDSQGETAGERARPRRTQRRHPPSCPEGDLQLLLADAPQPPAPVQLEEEEEEEERVKVLLQRKKLLLDLGVVQQFRQLLQGQNEGGGPPQEAGPRQQRPSAPRQLLTKTLSPLQLDCLTPFVQKTAATSWTLTSRQSSLRPAATLRNVNTPGCLQLETESHHVAADKGTNSAQKVHGQVRRCPAAARQTLRRSDRHPCDAVAKARCAYTPHDPADLQSLLVTSARPPLLRRPGLTHRGPHHGEGP